ncbi:hypothetical protein FLW16_32630 [Microbispora sp. KK1-11]|nr:hypothetical protein FLW16_32630 [Microbispora sp. KK1-11]
MSALSSSAGTVDGDRGSIVTKPVRIDSYAWTWRAGDCSVRTRPCSRSTSTCARSAWSRTSSRSGTFSAALLLSAPRVSSSPRSVARKTGSSCTHRYADLAALLSRTAEGSARTPAARRSMMRALARINTARKSSSFVLKCR